MKAFAQFKSENGITDVSLFKSSTGRIIATAKQYNLIVATNCDLKKPLFVIPTVEKGNEEATPNLLTIVNASKLEYLETI